VKIYIPPFIIVMCYSLSAFYRFDDEFDLPCMGPNECTLVQTECKRGCAFLLLDCTAEALPCRLREFVLKRFQHQTDAKVKSALNGEDGTE